MRVGETALHLVILLRRRGLGAQPVAEEQRVLPPRTPQLAHVDVDDLAGVARPVEPLDPQGGIGQVVSRVVHPVVVDTRESGGGEGGDEFGVVGVGEVTDPDLQVDDVLARHARHRRGPDVLDLRSPLPQRSAEPLADPLRDGGPAVVVVDEHRGVRAALHAAGPQVRVEGEEPLLPQRARRGPGLLDRALVRQDDVGRDESLVVRRLVVHPCPRIGLGHPALLHETLEASRLVRVDDDDEVVGRAHPLLDEQGHVMDHDLVRRRLRHELGRPLGDPRMGDRLEVPTGRLVAEDRRGQRRPVQRPVGREHPRPEALHDGLEAVGAGCEHFAGQLIRVDDERSELTQSRRHRRLARPDSTCQTDAQHASTLVLRCWSRG